MKQTKAIAAAAAFALFCTGCGSMPMHQSPTATEQITPEQQVADQSRRVANTVRTDSFLAEYVDMPSGAWDIDQAKNVENSVMVSFYSDTGIGVYLYSPDMSSYETIDIQLPDAYRTADSASYTLFFTDDGFCGILFLEDHGGMHLPKDGDENAEQFDYDAYDNAYTGTELHICTFASDGSLQTDVTVDNIFDTQFETCYFQPVPDGSWLWLIGEKLMHILPDGTTEELCTYEEPANGYTLRYLLSDRDGVPLLREETYEYEGENEAHHFSISEIDPETGEIWKVLYEVTDTTEYTIERIPIAGVGDYRICIKTDDALLGIRDDGTQQSLVNYAASDIVSTVLSPLDDGTYLGTEINAITGKVRLVRLRMREQTDESDITILTVGMLMKNDFVNQTVIDFNRSHEDCRIQTVDYSVYDEDGSGMGMATNDNPAFAQLKLDLISGKAPDIILMCNHSSLLTLGERGVFADLYDFIETDESYNRNTILPNVLKALESGDGQLYGITSSFGVQTIGVKKKFNCPENWTMDDLLRLYDENNFDAAYYYYTREELFIQMLAGMGWLVDVEKGTCRFDSEEMVQLLTFCSRFPEHSNQPDKFEQEEAFNQYITESCFKIINDSDPLGFLYWSETPQAICYDRYGTFDEAFTPVGYPSPDGKGGTLEIYDEIAITNTCPDKKTAWEFVRSYLHTTGTDTLQDEGYVTNGYSILKQQFSTRLDAEMNWKGEPSDANKLGLDIYPLTQKERDAAEEYIMSCQRLYHSMDEDAESIAIEEAQKYFAGDQSAEDAAAMMQSRAELLLSERAG